MQLKKRKMTLPRACLQTPIDWAAKLCFLRFRCSRIFKYAARRFSKTPLFASITRLCKKALTFLRAALFGGALLVPNLAYACACGCGVFDVGTGAMMPTGVGGSVWIQYSYMDQNRNWSGTKSANAANNSDKGITTNFITAGGQYMFDRAWGVQVEVPYWTRSFNTTDDSGNPAGFHHASWGDVRVKGVYAGFSDDMATGITYGLKLPTGDSHYPSFDRDTEIGTGSTDWLLGAYHMGRIGGPFGWFVNGQWEHAFTVRDQYRPGDEVDGALGAYYEAGSLTGSDSIAPLLQFIGSARRHDTGANAAPNDSGYTRLMISPGVEYKVEPVKLYADVEVPVYQNMNGNQLVAPVLTKVTMAYDF